VHFGIMTGREYFITGCVTVKSLLLLTFCLVVFQHRKNHLRDA
jgi:hypothetical protein